MFTSRLRNLVLAAGLLVAAAVISAQADGREQLTPPAALFPGDAEPNHREGAETHATKEEGHEHEAEHHAEEPADLFPCDFFRTGWDEPFEERPREDEGQSVWSFCCDTLTTIWLPASAPVALSPSTKTWLPLSSRTVLPAVRVALSENGPTGLPLAVPPM